MKTTTRLYQPIDISVQAKSDCTNPFFANITGIFEGPNGERLAIPGFYNGGSTWCVRFAPTAEGSWTYRLLSPNLSIAEPAGQLEAVANAAPGNHGGVAIDPDHPHHFRHADGTPHFMMAYEADWLWALGLADPDGHKTREFVDQLAEYRFTNVIVNIYAHDTRWCEGKTSEHDYGPPPQYAWDGTNEQPDHSRLNLAFFANYDRMMDLLLERGIVAHILLKVYNKMVNWPQIYSPEDELYFRYVTARYQAYPNVIWDFSKESFNEPDKAYIASRLSLIRAHDAYRHLLTIHDDPVFSAHPVYGRMLDFFTAQQHVDFYRAALLERAQHRRPYFNSEFGYEWGPGGEQDLTYRIGQSPEELLHRAYEVVMAGGYPAYYYTYTAWDVIDYGRIPPGYAYFRILHDFFSSIDWRVLEPSPDVSRRDARCLADRGRQYVLYWREKPWACHLVLPPGIYDVTWLNTHTGEKLSEHLPGSANIKVLPGRLQFKNVFGETPTLLHLQRRA
ncbi:MAG: DUF4038 domain-containing protein [Kiritimatiellae bacterium]|nr:DUF4038 domain-containing protein [Kiritimatiellia bacterium]